MTGRYDYERFINYFRYMKPDNVDNWWYGIRYNLKDNICQACVQYKLDFKDQDVYLYKPQLLSLQYDPDKEFIYYFVPLETLQKITSEQFHNIIKNLTDDVLIKKCKAERKLRNMEKDF